VSECRVCGAENPAGNRFCGSCGAELDVEAVDVREERKVITVVFADLVGFTERSERLDPEDVQKLLSPYLEQLRAELERFGGTVEKFIGDAVVALFGAPVAHEDDPERAVRAAIEIRDRIAGGEDDLQVRVGVNTGEALVRLGARPAAGEGMATGDVVNTAARLQSAAPVNGILVGERTRRATENSIEYREHEAVSAKGKAEPIPVWEALAPIRRLGVDVQAQAATPLVGRVRELDLLTTALGRVRAEASGQLVTLIGVPGIGKSRLIHELSRAVEADPEFITWRQGRCLPYGDGVSYWALGEIVKAQVGVRDNDPADAVQEKLRAAVTELISDETERAWVEAQLGPLIGVSAEGGASSSHEESAAAWVRFLEGIGEQGPAVLVFEDLHWADEGLLDFIDELGDRLAGIPLLVACSARPELLQRRPTWGGGKPNAATISLPALNEQDTLRLVEALLDGATADSEMREELLARAGGNPLYAEQYARLVAEGAELRELPESVQGIIAARLDSLPEAEKAVLLDASVIGKVFWLGAVAGLDGAEAETLPRTLRDLERKDFVQRARASSVVGEVEYAFRHVLLRDVAYGELPRPVRARKHLLAAEWLESLGRPQDLGEMLAHHYSNALALARAAGQTDAELELRAGRALAAAGERALSLGAVAVAATLLNEALTLIPADDPDHTAHLLLRGHALSTSGSQADALPVLTEAMEAFRAQGDVEGAAEAASLASRAHWFLGDGRRAEELLEEALALVADRPASMAKLSTIHQKVQKTALNGAYAEAMRFADEGLAVADEVGPPAARIAVRLRLAKATCTAMLGDSAALEMEVEAIERARAGGFIDGVLIGLNWHSASLFTLRAQVAEAASFRREYGELAGRHGYRHFARIAAAELVGHDFAEGRWQDALAATDDWLASVEAGTIDYQDPAMFCLRAFIRLGQGDVAGADADSARAVELARASDLQAQAWAFPTRARVAIELGDVDEARELAGEIRAMADRLVPALNFPVPTLADVAWVFVDLDMRDDLRGLLGEIPGENPWVKAAEAIAAGEPERAADLLEEFGHLANAAYCLARAGSAGRSAD
jgi:class 3 adenylate cyclase/tetratricopeptide (TPR) repeat protein